MKPKSILKIKTNYAQTETEVKKAKTVAFIKNSDLQHSPNRKPIKSLHTINSIRSEVDPFSIRRIRTSKFADEAHKDIKELKKYSKSKNARMYFDGNDYTSTEEFFRANACPIEKKLQHYSKKKLGQLYLRFTKNRRKNLFPTKFKIKKIDTPYDKGFKEKTSYMNFIQNKQNMLPHLQFREQVLTPVNYSKNNCYTNTLYSNNMSGTSNSHLYSLSNNNLIENSKDNGYQNGKSLTISNLPNKSQNPLYYYTKLDMKKYNLKLNFNLNTIIKNKQQIDNITNETAGK